MRKFLSLDMKWKKLKESRMHATQFQVRKVKRPEEKSKFMAEFKT